MNRYAYLATGQMITLMESFSRIRVNIHGRENIPAGSRHLFEGLGTLDKEYRLFPMNRHGILAGEGAEQVHGAIGGFIDRLLGGG